MSLPANLPVDQAQKVVFGSDLRVRTRWLQRLEDAPARHGSQEQPACSMCEGPHDSVIVNGTRGTGAYDRDGTLLWHVDTGYCPTNPFVGPDGTVYAISRPDATRPDARPSLTAARDDGNGMAVAWSREGVFSSFNQTTLLIPTTDGKLMTADRSGMLKLDPADGHTIDAAPWKPEIYPQHPWRMADGRWMLHDSDGTTIFRPDGSEPRLEPFKKHWEDAPMHMSADGATYWWKGDVLRCVEPDMKTERWSYTFPKEDPGVPFMTFGQDGTMYAVQSDMMAGSTITAMDPKDGSVRWRWKPVGDSRWAGETPKLNSTILLEPDGTFYVSGNDTVYAVGPDGVTKWRQKFDTWCNNIGFGPEGTLVIADPGSPLRVVRRGDGHQVWESPFTLGHGYPSTLVVADTIYTATKDCELAAVQVKNALVDESEQPSTAKPQPRVVNDGDVVIINGVRVPVRRGYIVAD